MEKKIFAAVRKAAGCKGKHYAIGFVPGDDEPGLHGRPSYHTNKSGDVICSANAYRRRWGSPISHPSTLHIVVGTQWILDRFPEAAEYLSSMIAHEVIG